MILHLFYFILFMSKVIQFSNENKVKEEHETQENEEQENEEQAEEEIELEVEENDPEQGEIQEIKQKEDSNDGQP